MKSLLLAILLLPISPVMGAVVFYSPPEPLVMLPDFPTDIRYDMNGDGRMDFQMGGYWGMFVALGTIGSNRYLAIPAVWPDLGGYPMPLAAGSIISSDPGAGLAWLSTDLNGYVAEDEIGQSGTFLVLHLSSGTSGTFFPGYDEPLRAFLGIEFESDEGTHYGYIDVYMPAGWITGYIMGWAYESEPGKSIMALPVPEPGSLLLGSFGCLALLRRQRKNPAISTGG